MDNPKLRLYTLDFDVPPEQMGDVHVYPLTPAFAGLWEELAKRWDRKEGFKTPHGSLRVALTTTTGRMIIFTVRAGSTSDSPMSRRSLIVSDGPLDADLARICFDTWQKLHFGDPGTGDLLSRFVDFDNAEKRSLADLLERDEAGYITGPWWWKNAIGWSIARRLAPHSVVDKTRPGKDIELTLSTDGRLVAWGYPWHRTTNQGRANERTGIAMGYVSIRGETRRGSKQPLVRIDCHVTRVAASWNNVKTVHLKHPQFPVLLRVPVASYPLKDAAGKEIKTEDGNLTWKTTFRGRTADIVQACGLVSALTQLAHDALVVPTHGSPVIQSESLVVPVLCATNAKNKIAARRA